MTTIRSTDAPVAADILLNAVTTTGPGNAITGRPAKKTFQADLTGSGATATVNIEGSNTGSGWVTIGTITLTTAAPADGFYFETPFSQVRANLTAIGGAGASVSCGMGS